MEKQGEFVTTVIQYARHDGISLSGDFYKPAAGYSCPVLVALHGGGWKIGSPKEFQHWGPWLAARGIALFSIEYRLVKNGRSRFPAAVHDVQAAVRFLRSKAVDLCVDPTRIGLMGASAGGHLAALVALAGDEPFINDNSPPGPLGGISTSVKAVIGVYGTYDLSAQWTHDQIARPNDNLAENFLGISLPEDRIYYFRASPIAYATKNANKTSFLLTWGMVDDVVDWTLQSRPFLISLKQAGTFVRTIPVTGAPHYWISAPLDEPGSHTSFIAPKVLRFLRERL